MKTQKTIEYKLSGTRRLQGAIGKMEPFTVTVSRQIGTITPKQAMNTARESMYQDGWDHILFTDCKVKRGKATRWTDIPMIKALGLE